MAKQILLVEDNATDEKLTTLAFRRSGIDHEIVVVRDGVEALDYLLGTGAHASDVPPLPTIVLLDLQLPRIGGLDVLARLRRADRTIGLPVVVMTSSKQDEDLVQAYRRGANAYVRKPVDFAKFIAAARAVGVFWLELNEQPA